MSKALVFIITILIVLISCPLLSQNVLYEKYDFRKTSWGMSREQVIAAEGKKPLMDPENRLVYYTNISDFKTFTTYMFIENRLVRTRYTFLPNHNDGSTYITDYLKIKNILLKKYGLPTLDEIIGMNESYRNDTSKLRKAIEKGDVTYVTEWEITRSYIVMSLNGDDDTTIFMLEYFDKKFQSLTKKQFDDF